jgi:pSer/pThr/pTyr-binding forkhead associated (FHA) protein
VPSAGGSRWPLAAGAALLAALFVLVAYLWRLVAMRRHGAALRSEPEGLLFSVDRLSTTLGRSPANRVTLENPTVSARHARVRFLREGFVIEDLGSANGTRVNGREVRRQGLRPGDEIRLGEATLRFETRPDR